MNRIIKFRAWFKETKYLEAMMFHAGTGYPEEILPFEEYALAMSMKDKEAILMQYTGLNDIDNKEIYEGDILKYTYNTVKIIWNNEESCFEAIDIDFSNNLTYKFNKEIASKSKIIGNIYEN